MEATATELDAHGVSLFPLWCSEGQLAAVESQLREMVCGGLPEGQSKLVLKLKYLALKRDLLALCINKPPHGLSELPRSLPNFSLFDRVLERVMQTTFERTDSQTRGLGLNSIFGPWEGGILSSELAPANRVQTVQRRIACWNGQGAFASNASVESSEAKIYAFTATLASKGTLVAIVSEPRLAPGMVWPAITGYDFHGERSTGPASVAALVHQSISHQVEFLSNYGDECAIWLALFPENERAKGQLLLGIYAPHGGHPIDFRRQFWAKRVDEARQLRHQSQYRDWSLLCVGDFNLHCASLCEVNHRLERPFDREMFSMFGNPGPFHLLIRNDPGIPTHRSGSIIDYVAASPALSISVQVSWLQSRELTSDHAFLLVHIEGDFCLQTQHTQGRSRWGQGEIWESALEKASKALFWIAGAAGLAAGS
eukprot:s611_g15.t1